MALIPEITNGTKMERIQAPVVEGTLLMILDLFTKWQPRITISNVIQVIQLEWYLLVLKPGTVVLHIVILTCLYD